MSSVKYVKFNMIVTIMGDRLEKLTRKAFNIPDWYVLCPSEENILFNFCGRAGSIPQARTNRALVCSAMLCVLANFASSVQNSSQSVISTKIAVTVKFPCAK